MRNNGQQYEKQWTTKKERNNGIQYEKQWMGNRPVGIVGIVLIRLWSFSALVWNHNRKVVGNSNFDLR